jgi:hypothetical protein
MTVRRFYALVALMLLGVLPAVADDNDAGPWIAKARAYLGSEQALNAVRSLHFQGSFAGTEQVPDPADAKKTIEQPVKVGIDIVFQAPMQQRQILRSEKIERITTLDGYDAWERVADAGGKGTARLTLLDGPGIKRLRATTLENLSFYSNRGGDSRQIKLEGEATVDGVECVKVSFAHTDSIVFNRYFEKATGRLVKTEINGGGEIREEGEILVNGVRFPRKVLNKAQSGRLTTITFEKVAVNEVFPVETFAVPTFQAK